MFEGERDEHLESPSMLSFHRQREIRQTLATKEETDRYKGSPKPDDHIDPYANLCLLVSPLRHSIRSAPFGLEQNLYRFIQ